MPGKSTKRRETSHRIYAVCPPGLERLLETELRDLGLRTGRRGYGGVEADATTRQVYAVNVWSRLATRIVRRWTSFTAESFAELELAARRLAWDEWRPEGGGFAFRVSANKSRLIHTDAIAERLVVASGGAGGAETKGAETDRAEPDGQLTVLVRFDHDRATLSIDSTGEALHRRGWRGPVAKAPIRPTLAAGLLAAAGVDDATSVVDPMCGSGTIAIEAARQRAGWPPGLDRSFAFQSWPEFEPGTWASVNGERRAAESEMAANMIPIVAADRDAGAVAATLANAESAGVADLVQVRQASISDLDAPTDDGLVVTNPPYGRRVSAGSERRNLYAALGAAVEREIPHGRLVVLTDDEALPGHCFSHGRQLAPLFVSRNGGITVTAMGETPTKT